jgi:hypothetical protein
MLKAKGERNTGEWRKDGDRGYGGSKHEGVEKSGFVDFHFPSKKIWKTKTVVFTDI